jgi:hypothetical protein
MFELFIAACVSGIVATLILGYAWHNAYYNATPWQRIRKHFGSVAFTSRMYGVDVQLIRKRGRLISATLLDIELGYTASMFQRKGAVEMVTHYQSEDDSWREAKREAYTATPELTMDLVEESSKIISEERQAYRESIIEAHAAQLNDFLDYVTRV